MLKRCAWVFVIAACGGSGQKAGAKEPMTMPTPAKSECAAMADHAAGVVLTFKDPPKASKDDLAKIIETHCDADAWSADAKTCWKTLATEDDAKKCVKLLSEDQHNKVFADFRARYGHAHDDEGKTTHDLDQGGGGTRAPDAPTGTRAPEAPTGSPPPPPTRAPAKAPARATKPKAPPAKGGGAPAKGDPCEGGE